MDLCKIITYTVPNYPQKWFPITQLPRVTQIYPELPKYTQSYPNIPTNNQYYSRILLFLSKILVIPRTTHFVQGITKIALQLLILLFKVYFGETQHLLY